MFSRKLKLGEHGRMYRKVILILFIILLGFSLIYALIDKRTVTTSSEKAYKAYIRGEESSRKLYFKESLKEYELAIKYDPEFAMAYSQAARYYKMWDRESDYENAKAKAIQYLPKVREKEQIQINLNFAAYDGDRLQNEKYAQELVAKFPESIEALVLVGNKAFAERNWPKCIKTFAEISEKNPDYALAYNMLGYAYYYNGDYDKALAYIDKYSTIAVDQANPHDSHGEILYFLGQYDKALTQFRIADSIKADLYFVLEHIGNTYRRKGMYRDAIGAFLKGGETTEGKRMKNAFNMNIAGCYVEQNQGEMAASICREIISSEPSNINAHCILGTVYADKGDIIAASQELQICQNLADSLRQHMVEKEMVSLDVTLDIIKACISRSEKDYKAVVGHMKRFIDQFPIPNKFEYAYLMARAFNEAGMYDSTVVFTNDVLKHNPNLGLALFQLATAYKALGQAEAQRQTLLRCLEVYKDADESFEVPIKAREELVLLDKKTT